LIFLPGRAEIDTVQDKLTGMGIDKEWVAPLHADLNEGEMNKALSNVEHPKAILATSIAETSITLPKVDHVLDAGFRRISTDDRDIVSLDDCRVNSSVAGQRDGRAGRVKPGSSTRFVSSDFPDATEAPQISCQIPLNALSYSRLIISRSRPMLCHFAICRKSGSKQPGIRSTHWVCRRRT